jgi:hypothetical protein
LRDGDILNPRDVLRLRYAPAKGAGKNKGARNSAQDEDAKKKGSANGRLRRNIGAVEG